MNGRIVEWIRNEFNTPGFDENDAGEKVPNPDKDAQRIILATGNILTFSKASPYGGTDRVAQLLGADDAKEIMQRHPTLFRYAEDLEQIQHGKETLDALIAQKAGLMQFIQDNAKEIADLLSLHLKRGPGRPLNSDKE